MFFLLNLEKKKMNKSNVKEDIISKLSSFSKLGSHLCHRSKILNCKILNFFFNIIFITIKDFKFSEFKTIKGSNFVYLYKTLFIYLQFNYFIIEFINNYFWLNSEKFFSSKKELVEFLMYYKFFLFSLFLNKKNKLFKVVFKFSFHLYFNYLVYSIFYFLRLYLLNVGNRELKRKNNNLENYRISPNFSIKSSYLFYSYRVYPLKSNQKKNLHTSIEEEVPLSLFCSNRINFKSLNDIQFAKLLNHIRYIYRYMNKKENSFYVLNLLVKRSIPLVKIIYQRRGRSLIPLMNFVYSQDIRNSLGLKFILTENNRNKGSFIYSYENRLFLNLLNILFSNIEEDFIYQSDKNSDVRKEAYSRGYYLKTLKARFKNS
jgi:hypothetical protein